MRKLPVPAGAVGGELDMRIIGVDVGFAELDFFGVFYLNGEVIDSDPRERTDGDTTTWEYHDTTGLELQKTYADARGVVKTNAYERARGLLLRTTYSDGTIARSYTYNHLGQLTQVTDDAGTRTLAYNAYGELEADVLVAGGVTHTITEQRDKFGSSLLTYIIPHFTLNWWD